ncbi:GlxA family transcriptional regulator [Marivita sp. GX14005]|uniref:GlxA family transcriptional regulator n=1 Tax=Marivita sp. GX14005 TaxID=2942276 RepID=UPI002019C25C|nr:GlxA family transcriptional regulator [Marivita sp. GX14005]MCL3883130.1 GlxA family transcriptional regulator [Marivita sp. GX14005]
MNASAPASTAALAPDVIPEGAFFFPVDTFTETRHLGFLLLPQFTLLAFSSALDPLRIANQLSQKPLYRWSVLSETGAPVASSSGIDVGVHGALTDLPRDMRLLVCSGNRGLQVASDAVLSILRRHVRFGGKVGGICTGASTLARAGLLGTRAFTLHWENQPGFIEKFPDLAPSPRRFEIDGDLWTCGGGAAATEMMLSIIRRDHGREFAIVVSDMCLNSGDLEPRTAQRSSLASALSTRNTRLIQIVQKMHQNIEDPLTLDDLSEETGLSRRQIERHFRQFLNESPMTTYRNIRLDRARTLFIETDMTVAEIAIACGFNSSGVFSRHYKERFGASPSAHLRKLKQG